MLLSEKELQELELNQSQFTNSISRAQKQMEARNFGIRKQEFEYDSVINRQRLAVYGKRDHILSANDQSQAILLYGYKNKPDDYWFDEL
jgi:preprotein translocase subunit SecA